MKLFLVILLTLLIGLCEINAQDYSCKKLQSDEKTRQYYFSTITFEEKKSFNIVRGVAEIAGVPTEDVFVEVFTNKNPKRVAGCKTGVNGRFSFSNLKKGNYTLRLSKDGGFQLTEIMIKVSPNGKNKKEINGVIEIGY